MLFTRHDEEVGYPAMPMRVDKIRNLAVNLILGWKSNKEIDYFEFQIPGQGCEFKISEDATARNLDGCPFCLLYTSPSPRDRG